MKHGEGRDAAYDMYVYQQMTFEEIAKRIGRSDKTIRTWADEGGWKEKRERDLKSRVDMHEKLHTLAQKIADRMILDCDSNRELSPQSLHALSNIIASMNRAYQYETEKPKVDELAEKAEITPESIVERVREILGA